MALASGFSVLNRSTEWNYNCGGDLRVGEKEIV